MITRFFSVIGDSPAFLLIFSGLFGLCLGSFGNVAIFRLPRSCLSIVKPGSFCPSCKTPLRWFDNIPLVSWLVLRGKCRFCKSKIPFRYLAVELFVGLLFVLLAWQILLVPETSEQAFRDYLLFHASGGAQMNYAELVASFQVQRLFLFVFWALGSTALVIASVIDMQLRIIPDTISLGGALVVFVAAPFVPLVHAWGLSPELFSQPMIFSQSSIPNEWLRTWLSTGLVMLIAASSLWFVGFIGERLAPQAAAQAGGAMGLGDVKLVMLLAGLLGWQKLLLAFLVAVFAGALFGLPVLIKKWSGKEVDTSLPFGPFLAFGTILVMLAARPLFEAFIAYMRIGLAN